jgi:hypothetical protein
MRYSELALTGLGASDLNALYASRKAEAAGDMPTVDFNSPFFYLALGAVALTATFVFLRKKKGHAR